MPHATENGDDFKMTPVWLASLRVRERMSERLNEKEHGERLLRRRE